MQIFIETRELVKKERLYTSRILENLVRIEKNKLYVEVGYRSLYSYIYKDLKYTNAEAVIRVNAVKLMLKSKVATQAITQGKLSLTNASEAEKIRRSEKIKDTNLLNRIVKEAEGKSTREFKRYLEDNFDKIRREQVTIDEFTLELFERFKKKIDRPDLTTYEVIRTLLERELKAPSLKRLKEYHQRNSRFIPKSVKSRAWTGECSNCRATFNLEYDHIQSYSTGGMNSVGNIQLLCRNCNRRKQIKSVQFF